MVTLVIGPPPFLAFWPQGCSHPRSQIHPYAIDLLKNLGYETSHLRSKSWDVFAEPGAVRMDFVFTVCDDAAKEVCLCGPASR